MTGWHQFTWVCEKCRDEHHDVIRKDAYGYLCGGGRVRCDTFDCWHEQDVKFIKPAQSSQESP